MDENKKDEIGHEHHASDTHETAHAHEHAAEHTVESSSHEHQHEAGQHHTHETAVVKTSGARVVKAKKAKKAKRKAKATEAKAKEAPKKKSNKTPYIIGGIVVAIIALVLIIRALSNSPAPANVDNPGQYGKSDVTFYVMSQCPYGVQVEDAFDPVMTELGENIDFRLEFIANENAGSFQSLHGAPEVEGDIIQLCVQDKYPKQLMRFVTCQNKDVQDLRGSIEKCAKQAGIDAAEITECADGAEGKKLLSESIKKSEAANAQGSPTIYINGQAYQGGRDAASFKRAVCKALKGHPSCESMPVCSSDADCAGTPGKIGLCENAGSKDSKCNYKDDEKISLTVLNSKDCSDCDASQLIGVLSQVFLNMDVKQVEASSSEGKALIKSMKLEKAPAFVFNGDVDKTYAWTANPRIQGAFRKVGTSMVLVDEATGATYILDPAKRQELEKLTGVTKGDNKPQIDFYVMSYCPFGNQAEEGIEPAYQLLKGKADFNPRYVIYSNYQGGGPNYCMDAESKYCSMHGVQEMNQDIREICVHNYMGDDAYFKFVLAMNKQCSASNADSCWEKVAKSVGLDAVKIKDCEKNEGLALAESELKLNKALGVSGSPTIFIEGAQYNGDRSAAGYAQALCAGFDVKPTECGASSLAKLGSTNPAEAASGSC